MLEAGRLLFTPGIISLVLVQPYNCPSDTKATQKNVRSFVNKAPQSNKNDFDEYHNHHKTIAKIYYLHITTRSCLYMVPILDLYSACRWLGTYLYSTYCKDTLILFWSMILHQLCWQETVHEILRNPEAVQLLHYTFGCHYNTVQHIDGLVQERRNSVANTLELRLSCTNPSMLWHYIQHDNHSNRTWLNQDFKLTKHTTYFALTGELWSVYCEDFRGN